MTAHPTDRYPALRTGDQPSSSVRDDRLEPVTITATLLAHTVRATAPQVRVFHPWGTSDTAGFAAMGSAEILVHGHDMARTFGIDRTRWTTSPRPSCARLFPDAPDGAAAGSALLWGTGVALPDTGSYRERIGKWNGEVR